MTCHAHHTDSSGPHTKHCVHRVATFMATCSNIGVVSVIVVIVLIEHCKDPSFTRWPHFSPSWTFRDHPSRLLTVTHSIMCTLQRCAISHSFDGLPARLDVLGSRPDHRRARAFELSPRSSQLPWRSSPRFVAMYSPAEMLHKGSEKIPSALPRQCWRGSQTALRTAGELSGLQDRVRRSVAISHAVMDASPVRGLPWRSLRGKRQFPVLSAVGNVSLTLSALCGLASHRCGGTTDADSVAG